jgi:hypothetical protein
MSGKTSESLLWKDLTNVISSSTKGSETDMSHPGIKPGASRVGVEQSSKELFEHCINTYSEHLYEPATWLPPVHVLHEHT